MTINLSPEALADLQGLKEFVAADFGEESARKVLKRIMKSIRGLEVFPTMGFDMMAKYGVTSNYRCLIINRTCVFYRVENETIHIFLRLSLRVLLIFLRFRYSILVKRP